MSFLGEMWLYLRVRRKFWLLPLFVVLGLIGLALVIAEGSAIAPFIYTIF